MTARRVAPLETVWVEVPGEAVEAYEAALATGCRTTGFFLADEAAGTWRIEGVRDGSSDDGALTGALALAAFTTGVSAALARAPVESEGWLARTAGAFPQQLVGRRFAIRGSHLQSPAPAGRITLVLDAGVAFGSGEHGSTRGCLRALERAAPRRPRHILDMGTGSGILAIAAARLLHRPVLATDIEPWSVRVTRRNAQANGVGRLVRPALANGWQSPLVRRAAPFDLVFANILARPLSRMARDLAVYLAPGGTAILAGLLATQTNQVLAAHCRHGLRLIAALHEGPWTTLVLCKRL